MNIVSKSTMSKIKVFALVLLMLVMMLFGLSIMHQNAERRNFVYDDSIRDIEELKSIINMNESVESFLQVNNNSKYDSDGNCAADYGSGECDYIISSSDVIIIYFLEINNEMFQIFVSLQSNSDTPKVRFYFWDVAGDEGSYISRGTVRFDDGLITTVDDYPYIRVIPNGSECLYYPFKQYETTCSWGQELSAAKSIITKYHEVLGGVGLTENELILYAKWFYDDVRSKISR